MGLILLVLFALGIGLLFIVCMRETTRMHGEVLGFEPQPSLTDDEFCELLPEIDPETALTIRGICADVSGWDMDEIHPNTRLIEFELW